MSKPVIPEGSNFVKGGGVLMIAERAGSAASSAVYGYRNIGDANSVALSREVETADIKESQSGSFQLARRDTVSETNTIAAVLRSMTPANFALFFGCDFERRAVSASPVTNELLNRAFPGAMFPIGAVGDFPEGLRTVTSIEALTISGAAWAATTAYALGAVVIASGAAFVAEAAGTSDASEPTWPSANGTVVDGTVTWRHLGPEALVAGTDFQSDLTNGAAIGIVAAGTAFATAMSLMPAGTYLSLLLDYTPTAESYIRLKPIDSAKTYALKFYGQADSGRPLNFAVPYCTAIGSGESQWINEQEPQNFTVEFSALKKVAGQLPIIPVAEDANDL